MSQLLRTAAYRGDLPEVCHLLAEGVDVNIWNEYGYTALTYAAAQGHLDVVALLLDNGAWADPHEDYDTYDTPLMLAVQHRHLPVVKALIAAGADPARHTGRPQATADFYARTARHTEIHSYLLQVERERQNGTN